jgi:hypothetical protein
MVERRRFITSDNPVVLVAGLRAGLLNGVSLPAAQQIWLPLRPGLVAYFSPAPEDHGWVDPIGVHHLNSQMRRNAVRFLVGHPGDL